MTVINLDTDGLGGRPLRQRLELFFAGLGQGFDAWLDRQARLDQVRALQALSHAELKARGIARDRIIHHVFRDKFHV